MVQPIQFLRRGLAAALGALHLAFALGAGAHIGPHVDSEAARLPVELHHHAFAFEAASPDAPRLPDLCVACQFTQLVPRLPATPPALPAGAAPIRTALPVPGGELHPTDLDLTGPRAPPVA